MRYLLSHLLTEQARLQPEKHAVICGEDVLSYAELDRQSNQIARWLQGQGVVRGSRVGISLRKQPAAFVALFGVLKAGAVCVPIDPTAPALHVFTLMEDADIRVLLTDQRRSDLLVRGANASVSGVNRVWANATLLVLDEVCEPGEPDSAPQPIGGPWQYNWTQVAECPDDPLSAFPLLDEDLAYILYTSGSTGRPKGVAISHRAALSFVLWSIETFDIGPQDRLSNHAPFHFDLSILDIYAGIGAGATVVAVPRSLFAFPRQLVEFIEEQAITVWYSVPSALTQLVLHGGLERFSFVQLRLVLFAGEVFPVRHLRALMQGIPAARFVNLYGPTETNVCTWHDVACPNPNDPPIAIGRPCANTEVLVVDEALHPVPDGVVGELCVRGPTLAQGYWAMPELSAKVFVWLQSTPELPAMRFYRTGDQVRLDEDGLLRFIGRRDAMVKSRGYRIELEAIESVLLQHPSVAEALVIALPHDDFGTELHASVVLARTNLCESKTLITFCAERLPVHMLPVNIEFREHLPKTSTGKIDRLAITPTSRTS